MEDFCSSCNASFFFFSNVSFFRAKFEVSLIYQCSPSVSPSLLAFFSILLFVRWWFYLFKGPTLLYWSIALIFQTMAFIYVLTFISQFLLLIWDWILSCLWNWFKQLVRLFKLIPFLCKHSLLKAFIFILLLLCPTGFSVL